MVTGFKLVPVIKTGFHVSIFFSGGPSFFGRHLAHVRARTRARLARSDAGRANTFSEILVLTGPEEVA